MGLDFIIQRKRKGEVYESDAWEEVVYGRNCWNVRDIVLKNISTYDEKTYTAKLNIGTLHNLVIKLAEDLKDYNLNNKETLKGDRYVKTMGFLGELASGLKEVALDYDFEDIEYEFRLIDSY